MEDRDLAHQSKAIEEAKNAEEILEKRIKLLKQERDKNQGEKLAPNRPNEGNKRKKRRPNPQESQDLYIDFEMVGASTCFQSHSLAMLILVEVLS